MGYGYAYAGSVVTDEVLFTPTGAFGAWARSIEFGLLAEGVREAPLNRRQNKSYGQPPVGSLKASIRVELTKLALRRYNIELSANTHYAAWVHEGTSTIIKRGDGGRFGSAEPGVGMYLPGNLGFKSRWRQRVRGQQGNPYLRRAWNDVATQHSSMGRFSTF